MLYLNDHARENTNNSVGNFYDTIFYPTPFLSPEDIKAFESGSKTITAAHFFEQHAKKIDQFYKLHRLQDFLPAGRKQSLEIADFGCGTGNNAIMLSKIFPEATIDCYDISSNALSHFQKTINVLGLKNINLYKKDIMTETFDKKYDLIFSLGVMHHTQDIKKTFSNITSTLKDGGKGIFFLYNFYGKLYEVLANRLVLILSDGKNKQQILEDGKLDRAALSTKLTSLIDLMALEHGEKARFTIKNILRPILKPVKKAPRESNWDAFAHEIAHFVDVEFIEGLVKNFSSYDIWFRGQPAITRERTQKLLKRTNLHHYVSEKTDFSTLVKINECLLCPRSTYFYVCNS